MNRAVVILYGISVVAFLVVLFRRVCEDEASLDEVERRRSRNPETVE
jgi:heme exporter protein D